MTVFELRKILARFPAHWNVVLNVTDDQQPEDVIYGPLIDVKGDANNSVINLLDFKKDGD